MLSPSNRSVSLTSSRSSSLSSKGKKVKGKKVKSRYLQCAMLFSLPQEISAESVLCYRKESAWEAFVDGLDVAEQFITSQSSLGTGNEIWWQFFPLVPKLVHVSLSLP